MTSPSVKTINVNGIEVPVVRRERIPDTEIPALRLACLEAALAAVTNDAGRMTGVYRDIMRLIEADPEFRRRSAELRPKPVDRSYQGALGATRTVD
jgi:hypothetical protein